MSEKNNEKWYSRTELLIGNKNFNKLQSSHILVAGLGGVGAYAAEQLVRAGIGELTIVDNDIIEISNFNRQLAALHSTLGHPKASILSERFKDINPDIIIHPVKAYLKDEILYEIISKPYDYVVDAIDSLSPKVYFLYHALKNQQKIVSSMGSGRKTDPSQIKIANIEDTHTDDLAFRVRKKLHKLGVHSGFKAIFSAENSESSKIHSSERNKITVSGTISYIPAIFGCFCASVVVQDMIGKDI